MAEAQTATAEKEQQVQPPIEPEVKERQETDAYIEQRQKEKNAPPPPVAIETAKPATPEELGQPFLNPSKENQRMRLKRSSTTPSRLKW